MLRLIELIKNFPSEGTLWAIAFREHKGEYLYEGNNKDDFIFIPNSFRYWRADPFVIDFEGKTFLFAELFDRIKGKGIIGVAQIINGKCGKFKPCLELDEHLSYPCVYEEKGEIYLIPESSRSGNISVYRSVEFPYKWEKHKEIYHGEGVDTTPCPFGFNDKKCYVSTLPINGNSNDNLYLITEDSKEVVPVIKNDFCSRPAGHFIVSEDKIYRPVQNCNDDYGSNILINQFVSISENGLKEETVTSIYPQDGVIHSDGISVSVKGSELPAFNGLHTYNLSEKYEVIDLAYSVGRTPQYFLRKLIKHFKK